MAQLPPPPPRDVASALEDLGPEPHDAVDLPPPAVIEGPLSISAEQLQALADMIENPYWEDDGIDVEVREDEEEEEEEEAEEMDAGPPPNATAPTIPAGIIIERPDERLGTVSYKEYSLKEADLYPGYGKWTTPPTLQTLAQLKFLNGLTREKQQEFFLLAPLLEAKGAITSLSVYKHWKSSLLQQLPIEEISVDVLVKYAQHAQTKTVDVGVHNLLQLIVDEWLEATKAGVPFRTEIGHPANTTVRTHIFESDWGERMKAAFRNKLGRGTACSENFNLA
jgi:hypothetical protein